jgi:magnesium transporter
LKKPASREAYERGRRQWDRPSMEEAVSACKDGDAFAWIGLYEPTVEEFSQVTKAFGLHELAVEDAIKAHQRPKLEDYETCLFMVLKPARYVDPEEVIEFGEILLFVGDNFLVTVRHGSAGSLAAVRRAAEHRPDLLANGPPPRCTPSSTRSWTTTGRSSTTSSTTCRRWRGMRCSDGGRGWPSASTS